MATSGSSASLPLSSVISAGAMVERRAAGISALAPSSFSGASVQWEASPKLGRSSTQRVPGGRWRAQAERQVLPPKLVTVLGKGGVGKTSAAVLLAKYYASTGRRTCLAVQSVDTSADALIGQRLSSTPLSLDNGMLTAVRFETTKLLMEPLAAIKRADAKFNFSQGLLDEVAGEELSVLPGMDALLAAAALERLAAPAGGLLGHLMVPAGSGSSDSSKGEFDIVVFDGPSSGEVLRMLAAPERTRWYLRRFLSLAEKTDAGRVALPSVARMLDDLSASGRGSSTRVEAPKSTAEIWERLDGILATAAASFASSARFAAFLLVQPGAPASVATALRLWGAATSAGAHVGGVFATPRPDGASWPSDGPDSISALAPRFSPLQMAVLPALPDGGSWDRQVAELRGGAAEDVLEGRLASAVPPAVTVDAANRTVTMFLPGLDKSEVKLSQWRACSELLVEVADQRRSVSVPPGMRGKVSGAKFQDNFLTVTLKKPT